MTTMRGRGLRCCLAAVAALLLGGCEDPARPEPVDALQAVPPAEFAVYAATPATVYVWALDDDGDPVRGAVIRWRVVEGGGTLSADSSATDENGLASATWTAAAQVGGTSRLEASHGDAAPVQFTATAETPVDLVVTPQGSGQSAPVLTPLPNPVGVRVTLPDGRPLPGVPVAFFPPSNATHIVPPNTVTDAQGFARAVWTMPPQAGAFTMTVRVGPPAQMRFVQVQATGTAGPPTQVVRVVDRVYCVAAGDVVEPGIGVRLLDRFSNPVPGVQVNFDVPGSGFTTPASMVTNAAGEARPQWTVRTTPGRDTLYAQIPAMNHTEVFLVDVCAGPTVRLELYRAGVPLDTLFLTVGQRRATEVRLFDRVGNPVLITEHAFFARGTLDSAVARVNPPLFGEGPFAEVEGVSPGVTRMWARSTPFADTIVVVVSPGPGVRAQAPPGVDASGAGIGRGPFAALRRARPVTVVREGGR